jgi:hypothetical protein
MKTIFALFSCLLSISALEFPAQPAHGDEVPTDTSLSAFRNCSRAIKNPDTAAENFDRTRLSIRQNYAIDLYIAKTPPTPHKKTDIVVWIENQPTTTGQENPTITAVCVNNQLNAPSAPKGLIEFQSSLGDKITFRFHLESLKISKWKKRILGGRKLANDSVQMQQVPGTVGWPPCLGKKIVDLIDDPATPSKKETDARFDFSACANTGHNTLYYEYTLILAQYPPAGGPPVDFPIDPWIINHP